MKNVILDGMQRLKLFTLIGAQRADVSSLESMFTMRKKIGLTDEERPRIRIREGGNGIELVDRKELESLGEITIELEDAEHRKLKEIINRWDSFSVDDWEWLEKVRKQLID